MKKVNVDAVFAGESGTAIEFDNGTEVLFTGEQWDGLMYHMEFVEGPFFKSFEDKIKEKQSMSRTVKLEFESIAFELLEQRKENVEIDRRLIALEQGTS